MSPTSRHVAIVRTSGSSKPCYTFSGVETSNGGANFQLVSCKTNLAEMEQISIDLNSRLSVLLPVVRKTNLDVEVGVVETIGRLVNVRQYYAIAMSSGALIGVADDWSTAINSPWSFECSLSEVDLDLPAVLMPSAALTLIYHIIDAAPLPIARRSLAEVAGLRVIDSSTSPYPPQHFPWLIEGIGSDYDYLRQDLHGADPNNMTFSLLARAERWQSPLGSLYENKYRNLRIEAPDFALCVPDRYVAIESLKCCGGPQLGKSNWLATCAVSESGTLVAIQEPLNLVFDSQTLVEGTSGSLCAPTPACDRDPIEGDYWGWAPMLLTKFSAKELVRSVT